jgi:hypothetical protein
LQPLREFFDTRPGGAAFAGVAAMATSYMAGATGWSLIITPLLVIAVYQLCFSDDGRDSNVNRYWYSR